MTDNQKDTERFGADAQAYNDGFTQPSALTDDLPTNTAANAKQPFTGNWQNYSTPTNHLQAPYPNMQYNQTPNYNPPLPKDKVRPDGVLYGADEVYDAPKTEGIKHSAVYLCIILIVFAAFVMGIFALGYFGVIKPDSAQTFTSLAARPESDEKYTIEQIGQYVRPAIVDVYCFAESVSDDEIDSSLAYASGSGIIISDDGYIVTNQHVISGAVQIEVVVYDEALQDDEFRSYTATVVGYDAKTDLAVIRINASNLTAAELGDASEAVLGEQVVAIGNPSGYSGTLTTGIISGLNRSIRTEATGYHMTCIQTDAPISPGNSGGALVNMYGQVIGITSSKIADTTVEGIGFAITINEAKPIIDDIINYGYVRGRYRIGIDFYDGYYNETYAVEGVLIAGIREDSDVYNTELKIGDVITEMNGVKVSNYDDITEALEGCVAGDKVKAKVFRLNEDTSVEEFEIEFELIEDRSGDY
ncbi:MAG: trypsin-like peptidase domain-containing protein [Oscillospiraceae bacterium]|nr:trypsin-like peptidase domain-containing protein [Oscillospiraceae bacterium]